MADCEGTPIYTIPLIPQVPRLVEQYLYVDRYIELATFRISDVASLFSLHFP
jgi:hypothetical protein